MKDTEKNKNVDKFTILKNITDENEPSKYKKKRNKKKNADNFTIQRNMNDKTSPASRKRKKKNEIKENEKKKC